MAEHDSGVSIQVNRISRDTNRFIKKNLKILATLAIAILFILLTYGYLHTRSELNRLSNSQAASQGATQDVVNKVGKLVELPSNETPKLVIVQDADKLKSQEFFARAKNGDRVLVYTKANRAILYRPSTNKIIEFSKLKFNNNQ